MLFNIYVGLTSSHYVGTGDFTNADEAMDYAYELAVEEYECYAGLHGIPSWEDCREEVFELYLSEPDNYTEDEIDEYTQDVWNDHVESWIQYHVTPTEQDDVSKEELHYL